MQKIEVGIVGFGFVGRAIQAGFAQTYDFRIYDVDPRLATHTLEEVCECPYIFVCVPTPMHIKDGTFDSSILEDVISKMHPLVKNTGTVVIIKSTVVPGTTRALSEAHPGLRLVFNPEFLTERTAKLDFINAARVIIGTSNRAAALIVEHLYRCRFPATPIIVTDWETAEMAKYAANCFFAVKVSLMNEYKQICDALGINYDELVRTMMLDGRIGNSHMDVPGHDLDCGFGGKCFPKDLNAMIMRAKELGVEPAVMEAAWRKNLEVRTRHDWEEIPGATSG